MHHGSTRRQFLSWLTALGTGVLITGIPWVGKALAASPAQDEAEVTPTEDLMREHGVLRRVLLIYEECGRRLISGSGFDPAPLRDAAGIIRQFIEEYHERQEEDDIFPRFERAGLLTDLVGVLRQQHQAGRRLTSVILAQAGQAGSDTRAGQQLLQAMALFTRMYRPHAAREDTVLFPALRSIMTAEAFAELGERFEDREHRLFGPSGFATILGQVAGIERTLGIGDLADFTP
jgi:hemerythrin-like domain-containing protein